MKKLSQIKLSRIVILLVMFVMSQIVPIGLYVTQQPVINYPVTVNFVEPDVPILSDLAAKTMPASVYIEVMGFDRDRCSIVKWSGSGVIVCPYGVIVTAGHVVRDAVEVKVTLNTGEVFIATGFRAEKRTDLGMIKISAINLPTVTIGNSNDLRVGDSVFAVGSPFGEEFFNSVTHGVVSGIDRDIDFFGEKLMIQTDTPINPGNSGGGLFDYNGRLMGITVGGIRGADGNGLCIPSNIVRLALRKYAAEIDFIEAE